MSVVNVDNRLVAQAARLAWEDWLGGWGSRFQRGLIKGRSMLGNILDIDWHSMRISLSQELGGLLLFDFSAASPSLLRQ